MKQLLCILFAGTVLLRPFLPVIEYALNYHYISTVLCENKDKPAMKCNGKCYLKKKINKAMGEEKENASQKSTNLSEVLSPYVPHQNDFLFTLFNACEKVKIIPRESQFVSYNYCADILRPPIFSIA